MDYFIFLKKVLRILRCWLTPPKVILSNDIRPLDFPLSDAPKVSIIIPVFNKAVYTFNCLQSVLQHTKDVDYEVIVVDNASTDNTSSMLSLMNNIRVLRNSENLGFVDACNKGADVARGNYIHFLNNDTIVMDGWLSALLSTFESNRSVGAVGSKLIYPNLKLQEAGSIVWSNARACNYGKFDDPERPEYNYLREVDYCSGASLIVKKDLFNQLGGFDRRFSPAYWEDTDLCFSIRRAGYKVFYQPKSRVVHFEGISAGRFTWFGMKRYQKINTKKFIEKWSKQLEQQPTECKGV